MDFLRLGYLFPQISSAIIFFFIIISVLNKRKIPIIKKFILLCANILFWSLMSIFEILCTNNDLTMFFAKLSYLSVASIPIFIYIFIFDFLKKPEFFSKKRIITLSIIPAISMLLALTNQFHHLFFSNESIKIIYSGLTSAHFERGLFFWIFAMYSYLLILIPCFFLIKSIMDKKYSNKKQAALILFATIIPFAGNIIFIFKLFGISTQYDLTTFLFIFTGIIFLFNIFKFNFLNIKNIVIDEIFNKLKEAIIIINEKSIIEDFNKEAEFFFKTNHAIKLKKNNFFNIFKALKINEAKDEIFFNIKDDYYFLNIKKIIKKGEKIGSIISIKNITLIKNYEKLKSESKFKKKINQINQEFLIRISHELRHPTMIISGYAQELKKLSNKNKSEIQKIINDSKELKEKTEIIIKEIKNNE